MDTFARGDKIGNYILDYRFPRGQGGEAWKVTDKIRGTSRVLKLPNFNADNATREIQRKGIEMEIALLGLMKQRFSPPAVQLVDRGQHKHQFGQYYPYIVLEFVSEEFTNLERHLDDARDFQVLPTLEMLEIFDLLLVVLEQAHSLGYAYNDVDIKHIYWNSTDLTLQNNSDRMRIIDWANAFRLDDPNKPLEVSEISDVVQAGEFLHKVVTYVNPQFTDGLPIDHIDFDVSQVALEARQRQFPDIQTFRNRIRPLILGRQDEIEIQIRRIYETNFLKYVDAYKDGGMSLIDLLKRVDTTLENMRILRFSFHRFFERAIIMEDRIRLETFRLIYDALNQPSGSHDIIAYLANYADELFNVRTSRTD